MRATRLSEIQEWHTSLSKLRKTGSCPSPGFFKPYHFVTMALVLKEARAAELNLPDELVSYAARMRLWEAIGLISPIAIKERPSGSRFHEITRLESIDSVENVSDALTSMLARAGSRACDEETRQSLFIMLTELLGNCHHHARAADDLRGVTCAQTWYQGARAQFAIADSGIGIRESLSENPDLKGRLSRRNACSLATELGISSKLNRGHAGYGLTVARDLALLTPQASLFVQSCEEAVQVSGGKISDVSFNPALPGTLVVFEWDTNKPLDVAAVYAKWPKMEDDDEQFF